MPGTLIIAHDCGAAHVEQSIMQNTQVKAIKKSRTGLFEKIKREKY
jgi:hypothetical protein